MIEAWNSAPSLKIQSQGKRDGKRQKPSRFRAWSPRMQHSSVLDFGAQNNTSKSLILSIERQQCCGWEKRECSWMSLLESNNRMKMEVVIYLAGSFWSGNSKRRPGGVFGAVYPLPALLEGSASIHIFVFFFLRLVFQYLGVIVDRCSPLQGQTKTWWGRRWCLNNMATPSCSCQNRTPRSWLSWRSELWSRKKNKNDFIYRETDAFLIKHLLTWDSPHSSTHLQACRARASKNG